MNIGKMVSDVCDLDVMKSRLTKLSGSKLRDEVLALVVTELDSSPSEITVLREQIQSLEEELRSKSAEVLLFQDRLKMANLREEAEVPCYRRCFLRKY